MKLNMSHVLKGLAGLGICTVIVLLSMDQAQAVLEGSNRNRLEYLNYSENIIRDAFCAKKGRATFSKSKRRFVRGVKRHNEPRIYQPDVYTWELAMNEHRRKLQTLAPVTDMPIPGVAPVPMDSEAIPPSNPSDNFVTARRDNYKASDIKRRIIEHMNSLDSKYPSNIPALQPAAL